MTIERLTPRSRRAWLAARAQDVTASTVAAAFPSETGIAHDWVTHWGLWMLKAGRLEEDPTETPAMQRGRLLEPVAVQMIREQHPRWKVEHNAANEYWRDPDARLGATPDVLVECPDRGPGIVQIKSVEANVYRRKWLVEGEPEPPLWIALQATVEAHLTGARWAAVAPLVVGGGGLECPLIGVEIKPGVIQAVRQAVAAFWASIDADHEPPMDYSRDGATIERLHALGDAEEEIDLISDNRIPELLVEIDRARNDLADAKGRKAAAEAEIKAKLGSATVGWIGRGRRITWRTQRRAASTVPASSFRVLRVPAPPDDA